MLELLAWAVAGGFVGSVVAVLHSNRLNRRRRQLQASLAARHVAERPLYERLANSECRCGVTSPHGALPFHRRPWCDDA